MFRNSFLGIGSGAMLALSQPPLDYTFYSTLYSFAHMSLLKKGLHLNYTVWECLSSTCYVLWALEDVELHEAHQLSALMELTFQQWEGMVGVPTSTGSLKKQESSRKTSISALLTMPKPLTVWITKNCGKPRRDSAEPRPRGCSGLGEPRPALPSF